LAGRPRRGHGEGKVGDDDGETDQRRRDFHYLDLKPGVIAWPISKEGRKSHVQLRESLAFEAFGC